MVQICFACGGQIVAAWNGWFDAKDIQSVASNYIVLEPTSMDGKLFSTYDGVRISPRIAPRSKKADYTIKPRLSAKAPT